MSITVQQYTPQLLLTLSDARVFAELVAIVVLVIVLTEREAIRGRPTLWASAGRAGLTAVALPLGISWAAVVVERFVVLLQ